MPWKEASPDGPAEAVHGRLPSRRAVDHRAVCAVRDHPEDRVQMDRSLHPPRAGRLGGAVAPTAALAAADVRRDRDRHPGRPASASALGRQETLGAAAPAPHPRWALPGRSTACDILSRHGMVPIKRQRRRIGHPGRPTSPILAPNDVWSADDKGQFRTGDGRYCYPLTVADGFSRYLLGCQALPSTAADGAKPIFTRLFHEYGLPKRIRTDNGVPFATTTLARLSKLSAWWVRLGILPELIEPGKPAQNGRHERMHRTLKAETTRPAAGGLAAQQQRFNLFREEFNHERPHEALDQATPATCYAPSPRPMPDRLPLLEYPDRFEVRYVSANGGIRWNSRWVNVSTVCVGEYVGLEEIADGIWNVYFGPLRLGRLSERHLRIEDAYGRLYRRHV